MRKMPHSNAQTRAEEISSEERAAPGARTANRAFTASRTCLFIIGVLLGLWLISTPMRASEQCLSCHAPASGLTNSQGKSIVVHAGALQHSVHKDLGCVDCHAGAAKPRHTAKTAAASCVSCHGDVSPQLAASAHAALGKSEDSSTCISCHGDHDVVSPSKRGTTLCLTCHSEEVREFALSVHGKAHGRGNGDAPNCRDCHGATHTVVAAGDANSPVSKAKLPETCGRCHSNPALAAKYLFAVSTPVEAYEQSVHGRAIRAGNQNAAACNNCHGVHNILPASDLRSPINKFRVASTCARCHPEVFAQFKQSIHGKALAAGVDDAPTCTDCHGEHRILAPSDPRSPVYVANIARVTCSHCHADQRLNARLGIPGGRVASYENSYHGLAAEAGSLTVANCASCHGVHNILPSSDARSTIAKANLAHTCGKCHPDAGQRFAIGPVHVFPSSEASNRWVYLVRAFYLLLIPATVGFMFLHNFLDWLRKLRRHLARHRARGGALRLTLSERVQHALLLTSFITLVVTGFMLKFPDAFWAAPLVRWERDFPVRGLIHRLAGVVLIGAGFYHLLYLLFTSEGRRALGAMLPRLRDVRDAVVTVGYNLGYRHEAPRYAKFNYAEKVEYWSLVWGTIVMALTGVLLWAHNFVLKYSSKTLLDVATAVHYYEAILATLAIVIWHFYAVIFDPEVYPLKGTFLDGRAPEHEVREEEEAPAATPATDKPVPDPATSPAPAQAASATDAKLLPRSPAPSKDAA